MKSLIVLGVVVGAVIAPGAAHAADGFHNCGSNVGEGWTYGPTIGAGIFDVKARKVSCRKARYIAVHHHRWSMWHSADYNEIEYWRGPWTCNYRSTGYESGRIRCLASYGRRVRWLTGA